MGKEPKESQKEITIIGVVRENSGDWKSYPVAISCETGSYVVTMNEEGQNLRYEVGNRVEVTGTISRTKDGLSRIAVSGYEVYEMPEDDPEASGYGLD